jgi:hypothetical protein
MDDAAPSRSPEGSDPLRPELIIEQAEAHARKVML